MRDAALRGNFLLFGQHYLKIQLTPPSADHHWELQSPPSHWAAAKVFQTWLIPVAKSAPVSTHRPTPYIELNAAV